MCNHKIAMYSNKMHNNKSSIVTYNQLIKKLNSYMLFWECEKTYSIQTKCL